LNVRLGTTVLVLPTGSMPLIRKSWMLVLLQMKREVESVPPLSENL
jgi:hypothetical protein